MSDLRGVLARSKDGSMIHRTSCRYARVPWNWADDKPRWVVEDVVARTPWLSLCGKCKPLIEGGVDSDPS